MIWGGGALVAQAFGVLAQRAGDPAQSMAFGKNAGWVANWLYMPASLVVLVTGGLLISDGNWDWGEPFVVLGLVGWALVVVVGFGYVGPALKSAGREMAESGPSPELAGRMRQAVLIARVLVAILFVLVLLMVVKPGT